MSNFKREILLTSLVLIIIPFVSSSFYSFPNKIDTLQERINVQTVLNFIMFPSPDLKVDGVFGKKSIQAIQSFQESHGLVPDGKIGPITRAALESSQTETTTSTTNSISSNTTTGCLPGAKFNVITGNSCTSISTSSLPTGCTSTSKFSTTTGASCLSSITSNTKSGGGGSSSSSATSTTTSSAWQSGLVSWLKFNGNKEDSIGSNTVTTFGVTQSSSCVSGNCYDFSGGENYIVVRNSKNIYTENDNYSLAGWFYLDSSKLEGLLGFSGETDKTEPFSILNCNINPTSGCGWLVRGDSDVDSMTLKMNKTIGIGSWHHVVMTKGGNMYTIYLDGIQDATTTHNFSDTFKERNILVIGDWNEIEVGGAIDSYFDGKIDEVMTWNRALSSSEISSLYNSFNFTPSVSCSGSSTQSCLISNGTGIQSRTCSSGVWSSYGACTVSTCSSGYQISGNSCITTTCSGSPSQSCSISNGTGTQSRTCNLGTWSSYGSCAVSSCNTGYQISGNTCVPLTCSGSTTQSCSISNGTGIQSRTCNLGTWSSYGTCTVSTCNSGYIQSNNTCIVQTSQNTPTSGATFTTLWDTLTPTIIPGESIKYAGILYGAMVGNTTITLGDTGQIRSTGSKSVHYVSNSAVRSEIFSIKNFLGTKEGDVVYFGWSDYFSTLPMYNEYTVFQWRDVDEGTYAGPNSELVMSKSYWDLGTFNGIRLCVRNCRGYRGVVLPNVQANTWYDFVVARKYTKDNTGYMIVWAGPKGTLNYSSPAVSFYGQTMNTASDFGTDYMNSSPEDTAGDHYHQTQLRIGGAYQYSSAQTFESYKGPLRMNVGEEGQGAFNKVVPR